MVNCTGCGDQIYPGETYFIPTEPTGSIEHYCYRCGIGIELEAGRITEEQAAMIQAYGGG